jgi:hypothetical protein
VPQALDRIVLKALAKDADARFQYASDLGDELQRFLITRESIFSRKDLMQYMKSTFAEDLEREKLRLQEYGEIKAPEEMLEAIERSKMMTPIPLIPPQQTSGPAPAASAESPLLGTPGWNDGARPAEANGALGETLVYDRNTGSRRRGVAAPRASARQGAVANGETVPSSPPLAPQLGSNGIRPAEIPGAGPPPNSERRAEQIVNHPGPPEPATASRPHRSPGPGLARTALMLVALSAAGGGGWLAFREFGEGVLYIDIPESLYGKVRVNLDGSDLGPANTLEWPLVRRTLVGSKTLVMTAQGWKPFTTTVDVKAGSAITEVHPNLQREVETAQLILGLVPVEAEVRLDGQTVKQLGDPQAPYVGEVVVGKPVALEVRMPGYKPFTRTVSADSAVPVRLTAALEPVEFRLRVTSDPPGAEIRVAGRGVGETPAEIAVPPGTAEVALAKKCFDELVVPVKLPAEPGEPLDIPGKLERQPGCR